MIFGINLLSHTIKVDCCMLLIAAYPFSYDVDCCMVHGSVLLFQMHYSEHDAVEDSILKSEDGHANIIHKPLDTMVLFPPGIPAIPLIPFLFRLAFAGTLDSARSAEDTS